jgi:6,7-dimethyl-8-ribityllumazine synthase
VRLYPSRRDAAGLRLAAVVSRFNHLISARLLEGCAEELLARGAAPDALDVAWVPGAFEIPQAAHTLAASGRYDAVVALGVVIRGGTPHFEYVCRAVADGVREIPRDTGVPVAFGVLTCDDVEQALARAGGEQGNKGAEAALAAVEMAHLVRALGRSPGPARPAKPSARPRASRPRRRKRP